MGSVVAGAPGAAVDDEVVDDREAVVGDGDHHVYVLRSFDLPTGSLGNEVLLDPVAQPDEQRPFVLDDAADRRQLVLSTGRSVTATGSWYLPLGSRTTHTVWPEYGSAASQATWLVSMVEIA